MPSMYSSIRISSSYSNAFLMPFISSSAFEQRLIPKLEPSETGFTTTGKPKGLMSFKEDSEHDSFLR